MRNKIIAGNWKMYKSNPEATKLVKEILNEVKNISKTGIIVCPPFTALNIVSDTVKNSNIKVGAQNIYWEKSGAYTGEISGEMILSTGATYVIIGHSERRQLFGETDATVNKKIKTALQIGLKPIVCFGETLEQREAGVTKELIGQQIELAFKGLNKTEASKLIIAYEPVWAIGTGKTATPEQAQDVHAFIRDELGIIYGTELASKMIIQYGGSVKPGNAKELLSCKDIDGALVGGACLEASSFAEIIKIAENI